MTNRNASRAGLLPSAFLLLTCFAPLLAQQRSTIPSRLADREFWTLSQSASEPGGVFQSDNLVSNEVGFQKVLPDLTNRHAPGGVYLGVGPEQNFTYIAALRPAAAFIVDIRRENRDLHLMYKALFELAATRAEFVSLLFSRPAPDGLSRTSSAAEMFDAFDKVSWSLQLQSDTFKRIDAQLRRFHHLTLTDDEVSTIKSIHQTFSYLGPEIAYNARRGATRVTNRVNYGTLMRATDSWELESGYLASEARFRVVKDLHIRNLLIPVVGNFAGPKALRAVGDWLKAHQATVSVFYLSNVEDYLRPEPLMAAFCQNAAALPLDDASTFIRSGGNRSVSGPATPPPPPRVSGWVMLPSPSSTSNSMVVAFSDGSRREMTNAEFSKLMPVTTGVAGNRLGLMRQETAGCGLPSPR